jgi:hypothetical protein
LKFRGGFSQVNYKHILAAVLGAATLLVSSGCGTSDKLASITLSSSGNAGFFEIQGEGGILQLVATANYTSGKTVDVTNFAVFTATPVGDTLSNGPLQAPPNTMTMSPTGLMTAVQPFVCTFTNVGTTDAPAYALVGSYQVTVTYKRITSQPVFIGVASRTGDGPSGACGP